MVTHSSIYQWSKSKKEVFISAFDTRPTLKDVNYLVSILPQLIQHKSDGPRLYGLYDLQGNKPAHPIHVIMNAQGLLSYRKALDKIILINVPPKESTAAILEQINLIAKYEVYILKQGSPEQQKIDLEKIATRNKEVAMLINDYLDINAKKKSSPFTLVKNLSL